MATFRQTNVPHGGKAPERKGFFSRWFESIADARMAQTRRHMMQEIGTDQPLSDDWRNAETSESIERPVSKH